MTPATFTQDDARELLKQLASAFRRARHKTLAECFDLYTDNWRSYGPDAVIRSEIAEILFSTVDLWKWQRRARTADDLPTPRRAKGAAISRPRR